MFKTFVPVLMILSIRDVQIRIGLNDKKVWLVMCTGCLKASTHPVFVCAYQS